MQSQILQRNYIGKAELHPPKPVARQQSIQSCDETFFL